MSRLIRPSPSIATTADGRVAYVPFTAAPFAGIRAFPEERL